MPVIGVFSSSQEETEACIKALESWDAGHVIFPLSVAPSISELAIKIDGLLIAGRGDTTPNIANPGAPLARGPAPACTWDESGLSLLEAGLGIDIPILAIGRGFQLLNLLLQGSLLRDIPAHSEESSETDRGFVRHRIWISPGSKLAGALGSGGRVRVSSSHQNGLREAQKSARLLASAYSLEDGIIEALESPYHRWVLALQFHPEFAEQLPRQFQGIFGALVDYAEGTRLARSA
jgi:putative glutamine amidotransferase